MALVQTTKSADSNDGSATTVATAAFAGSSTAGNCIVGHISWQGAGNTVSSVSDGVTSGTVFDTTTIDTPNGIRMATYVIQNITSGGPRTVTATFSGNVQFRRITAQEFSGVATTGQPNKHALNSSATFGTGSNACISGSQTTTVTCLIWGVAYDDSTATVPSVGTTPLTYVSSDSATFSAGDAFRTEYATQSAAGSAEARFTTSAGTDTIGVAMLAIEVTASSGGGVPRVMHHLRQQGIA